jgi:two-component system sensor histidine kinase/response regulator
MKKVVIIDDDRINQEILFKAFTQKGYEVVSILDSRQCIKEVVKLKPDLILLDLLMPGLNGFEVLQIMKEKSIIPQIPVIILTALREEVNIKKALNLSAQDYWLKTDYNPSELVEKINKIIDQTAA